MSNLIKKLTHIKMRSAKRVGAIALLGALVFTAAPGCASNGGTSSGENGKYSNLLMSVVNDEYYKSLVQNQDRGDYAKPQYDPHPYAFLEEAGIDVNKILNGTYQAETMSFVLEDEPNNLYINTKVLIDDSYWHSFLITYKLNDKEMADYFNMHGADNSYHYYWPAFFMNDKISATKDPTNVQETKYTKETKNGFDDYFLRQQGFNYIFPEIGKKANRYSLILYNNKFHSGTAFSSNDVFITELGTHFLKEVGNSIFELSRAASYNVKSKEETSGNFFSTQNYSIGNRTELELEQ